MRRLLGSLLLLLSVILFATTALLSMAVRHANEVLGGEGWIVWIAAGITGGAAFWLWKKGKQLRLLSASDLMASDPRPPVLYLRSFHADLEADQAMQGRIGARLLPMSVPQNVATEEEQIAQVMSLYGPFVAIGRPGEHLPQLGAARMYTTDESWQDIITDLLQRSQLIIMRVGETEGFWWEVANASTLPDPGKIVFLLPTSTMAYEKFQERAQQHLPILLPETYSPEHMTDRSFGGMLWFESDWTPHIELCDSRTDTASNSVASDLREKLSPVLDSLPGDQFVSAPPLRRLSAALLDVLIFFATLSIYIIGLEYLGAKGIITGDDADIFLKAIVPALYVFIYFGVLEATPLMGTPAKLMLGLTTRDRTGVPIALLPGLLRAFIKFFEAVSWIWLVSTIFVFLGKRPIHDYFTRSTVLLRQTNGA